MVRKWRYSFPNPGNDGRYPMFRRTTAPAIGIEVTDGKFDLHK
jgi:hypothetical protein